MTDRVLYTLVALCGAAVIAVQAAIKPPFDPKQIDSVAAALGRADAWTNRPAPDFELTTRGGGAFRLSDHIGRDVVVLNFFATWCGPCQEEMPELQYYARRMAGEGRPFVLLAIDAQESADSVDVFAKQLGLTFPMAIDDTAAVAGRYGVDAFPTTVVIGVDGLIKLYESGRISNADVALTPTLSNEFSALASTATTADSRRQGWAEALRLNAAVDARTGFTAPLAPTDGELRGRALSISQVMPCPCGCDDTVLTCTCHTARAIKARLRAGVPDDESDGEVMRRLDKEFCMKGM
jgi:peroxiredoxin